MNPKELNQELSESQWKQELVESMNVCGANEELRGSLWWIADPDSKPKGFESSIRSGESAAGTSALALIMIDVDRFKDINDSHGTWRATSASRSGGSA